MKNKKLANCSLYTDLAIEKYPRKSKDIQIIKKAANDITITTNIINSQGRYISIEFQDTSDQKSRKNITKVLISELKEIMNLHKIKFSDSCLLVGLGNINSTPDSLGPNVVNNVLVTSHLFKIPEFQIEPGYRDVAAIIPNVTGLTGIETYDLVEAITRKSKPKFIIVIDALIAKSLSRINKVIQITDTGILPGSGIGNYQKEISRNSLGIPVISIGVPTIVDIKTIINDSLNYYSKNKKNIEKGLKGIFSNISNSLDYSLIVTPKDIDFAIKNLSEILINGINKSLHKRFQKK